MIIKSKIIYTSYSLIAFVDLMQKFSLLENMKNSCYDIIYCSTLINVALMLLLNFEDLTHQAEISVDKINKHNENFKARNNRNSKVQSNGDSIEHDQNINQNEANSEIKKTSSKHRWPW